MTRQWNKRIPPQTLNGKPLKYSHAFFKRKQEACPSLPGRQASERPVGDLLLTAPLVLMCCAKECAVLGPWSWAGWAHLVGTRDST